MRRDTLFRIASMTKPVVAVAALSLVESGHLRLHDPIDPWLPELAHRTVMRDPNGSPDDTTPALRPITLHDLLTFRPGIGWGASSLRPRIFALTAGPMAEVLQIPGAESLAPDAWMARLGQLPLLYQPGDRWLYRVAAEVLGVLISRVAGAPLEVCLRREVLEPLAMADTSFAVSEPRRARLATLYSPSPGGALVVRDHPRTTAWAEPPLFPSGGGGLVATADDFQRFGRMLLGQGALGSTRVLSRRAVELMTTDHLTPAQRAHPFGQFDRYDEDRSAMWTNRGFGYGVAVRTKQVGFGPSVGAFHWPGAFGTTWVADPREDLVATLMVQLAGVNPFYTQLGEDFLTFLYQAIEG